VSAWRVTASAVAVALATVAADQIVKAIVRGSIGLGEEVGLLPGIHLVHVRNFGVAFSMFSEQGGAVPALLASAALAALLAFFVTQIRRPLVWLPTGLLVGGAAGNLIDRARQGWVTDFVKLPHWPAFNVADIAITFGVLALLYVVEVSPRRAARG
jgi:signal peptidase II